MRRARLLGSALVLGCAAAPPADAGPADASATASESLGGSESTSGGEAPGDGDPGDGDGDGDGDASRPRVLFIGNSYTFVNDLPALLASIAEASPTPLETDSLTMAGARVGDHLVNPELETKLATGFDVVVIQGQSLEPILDYPGFEEAVVELAAAAGDARVLLFQTWPRAADSPELVELGMTAAQMWAGLESGYFEASLASDSEVASVGGAWMSALELEPPIELYLDDGSHPALAGSYLAGCVFFGQIVERSCMTSSYAPPELAPDDAGRLQLVADITNGIITPGP